MNTQLRIEYYLRQLDQYLQALPVGDRAEIITEIKSHISDVLERDPQRNIESVLVELGTPRESAERYLLAKGLRPSGPPRAGRTLKWLAIGTVALFALILVAGLSTIWYLSPLIQVDRAHGHITLFGGLIDVNEQIGHVKFGDVDINDAMKDDTIKVTGDEDLTGKNVHLMKIPFNNAKLEIRESNTASVGWSCKTLGGVGPKTEILGGVMSFNLDALNVAKCVISIPKGLATEFKGVNGHMEVNSPSDSMKISLVNGKVNISLDPARIYDFDVKVKNGLQDFFPRSNSKQAVRVQVDVINGLVKKE